MAGYVQNRERGTRRTSPAPLPKLTLEVSTTAETNLQTREDRRNNRKTKPETRYFVKVTKTASLVYRKGKKLAQGKNRKSVWQIRLKGDGDKYKFERIGIPDDYAQADGRRVLDYWQAFEKVRQRSELADKKGDADVPTSDMTVADAFAEYLAHRDTVATSRNAADDRRVYDNDIEPVFGKLLVTELTKKKVRKWHDDLVPEIDSELTDDEQAEQRRKKHSTANRKLTVLKAGLNYGWHGGSSVADAWREVKPFGKTDAPEQPWFESKADAKRLLRKVPAEFRPVAQAALITGMRYGELCALKVADVKLKARTVTVRGSAAKSGKPRDIPMADEDLPFFEEHTAGKKKSDLVFTHSDGRPWKRAEQTRPMNEANKAAEIDPAVNLHGLRRTYASWLAMDGVPLQAIQKVLGHSSIVLTEKHYAHLVPNHVHDLIRTNRRSLGIKSNVRKIAS